MSDDLEQEIARTREHLAETVDALTAKAEDGARRSLKIGVPIAVVIAVGVIIWRRRH